VAVLRFAKTHSLMFGAPNDETLSGHPLYGRGLTPYGAFTVERSSWIRELERINSVHRRHRPERFSRLTHYIVCFHDSCFECVAAELESEVVAGPLKAALLDIAAGVDI
jgi:hypothetical protein